MRLSYVTMLLLTAGCATRSLPFAIERSGTLPVAEYSSLERQAAAATPVVKLREGIESTNPEPYWVYSFKPGFDPHQAILQVGSFTGEAGKSAEVAAELPEQLVQKIIQAHAFASVTLQPTQDAYILSGKVTRAISVIDMAGTQLEAIITRNGAVVGVIQVNVLQLQPNPMAFLVTAIYSAIQGSRASFVSQKVREIFQDVAAGKLEGIDTETSSRRFLYPPPTMP